MSLALVLALTVASSVRAEEKQERNLAAHYGLGVGAAICSVVYGPVKIVYATLGSITSGFAWLFTGGRTDIAREIHRYALPRLPQVSEPSYVMAAAGGPKSGIIEID